MLVDSMTGATPDQIKLNPLYKNITNFEIEFMNDVQFTLNNLTYSELQNMNWKEAIAYKKVAEIIKKYENYKK